MEPAICLGQIGAVHQLKKGEIGTSPDDRQTFPRPERQTAGEHFNRIYLAARPFWPSPRPQWRILSGRQVLPQFRHSKRGGY